MESSDESAFEKSLVEFNVCLIPSDQIEKTKPHIGEGGFGKVYRGFLNGVIVAIKKIKLEEDGKEKKDVYADIFNEIKVIHKANHPNIPKFFGVWKKGIYYHLIFEFIEGKSWKYCYESMDRRTKLQILKDLCEIIQDLHTMKLIHRDIKPDNVMIEMGNKPRLIDFGVSKIATKTATFTKVAIGTIPYMAPEMYDFEPEDVDMNDTDAKPVPVSTYSDIWSFGCMMSEVFSGLKPWHKKKDSNVLETYIVGNLTRQVKFPIPNTIDSDIKEIIEQATQYDPFKRPTAGDLKLMIERIL
jgi:serine/threonine protein kinase